MDYDRIKLDFPIEFSIDGRDWVEGKSIDFSLSGLFALINTEAPEDSKVYLKIFLPDGISTDPVKVIGKVDEKGFDPRLKEEGMRISFQNFSGDGEQALYNYFKSTIPKAATDEPQDTVSEIKTSLDESLDEDSRKFFEQILNETEIIEEKETEQNDDGFESFKDELLFMLNPQNIGDSWKFYALCGLALIGLIYLISRIFVFFSLF